MNDHEARQALAAAQAEQAKTRKPTARSIVEQYSNVCEIGFSQRYKVSVIAKAIWNSSGADLEIDTIEKAIRKLPNFPGKRRNARRSRHRQNSSIEPSRTDDALSRLEETAAQPSPPIRSMQLPEFATPYGD